MQNGKLPARGEDRHTPEGVRPQAMDVSPGAQDEIESATARDTRLGKSDETRRAAPAPDAADQPPVIEEEELDGNRVRPDERQDTLPSRANPLR